MTGFASLNSAREFYAGLGFQTLPIPPGSKQAQLEEWQSRSSLSLWQNANENSNLGIRCGGLTNLAVIDCDEKQQRGTFENAQKFLAGLGYLPGDYPVVQTASGIGRHIYVTITEPIAGNYKHLLPEFGAGEFRYGSGAYVLAPPSMVQNPYSLIAGDFRQLPRLGVSDISGIIDFTFEEHKQHKHISKDIWKMLKGQMLQKYDGDRSRADQALINALINNGHEFEDVLQLFQCNPTNGKFMELYSKSPKRAFRYLRGSFQNGKIFTANKSPGRKRAQQAIRWAQSQCWRGRTGAMDKAVFLAHAQLAERCGKLIYGAGCRELAELANTSHITAAKATRRLRKQGLLKLEVEAVARCSAKYSLTSDLRDISGDDKPKLTSFFEHDAFSTDGLNKSGALIWEALHYKPMTLKELIDTTGKTRPTVIKRLKEMKHKIVDIQTGEIISMVYEQSGIWYPVEGTDLDYIAELLNVAGKGAERKRKHKLQQKMHQRGLDQGRKKDSSI